MSRNADKYDANSLMFRLVYEPESIEKIHQLASCKGTRLAAELRKLISDDNHIGIVSVIHDPRSLQHVLIRLSDRRGFATFADILREAERAARLRQSRSFRKHERWENCKHQRQMLSNPHHDRYHNRRALRAEKERETFDTWIMSPPPSRSAVLV